MSQEPRELVMPPTKGGTISPVSTPLRGNGPRGPSRPAPAPRARTDHLSGAQKAAIVVRVLLSEGLDTPISALPPDMQAVLTRTLGSMRLVDRATMAAVVEEFVETLEQVGLSFPDGLEGALSLLDGKLDDRATRQLRALTRGDGTGDPWSVLELVEEADLIEILKAEAQVVGAVLLSKLSTDKAARLLMRLSSELAQGLAIAIARTEDIAPEAVARIGATLAEQVSARPARAFSASPSKRMGEILNASPAALRQQLLDQLASADAEFASGVRESIFIFHHVPDRVAARDVPAIIRVLPKDDLMVVIATNRREDQPVVDFLLENMSRRAAEMLREEASALPPPDPDALETALNRIAATVRGMADDGSITLRPAPTQGS